MVSRSVNTFSEHAAIKDLTISLTTSSLVWASLENPVPSAGITMGSFKPRDPTYTHSFAREICNISKLPLATPCSLISANCQEVSPAVLLINPDDRSGWVLFGFAYATGLQLLRLEVVQTGQELLVKLGLVSIVSSW